MTKEELEAKIDEYVKDTCLYYRSTHEDMLPNQFEKYLRKACVYFATETIKEFETQIEQKTKEEMEEVASALAYQRTAGVDNRIADLEDKLANADYQLEGRDLEIKELKDEVRKLKLLVSSLVYEINQIWDINEMNDDLRMCAEKIDREVQLSKMAEDNRMVISALGFAIVPPSPKLDVKEV